ncbi:MAG: hypothetical protein II306_06590 [Clostridia bacterium]|nr:hypothetical protein [Clostridia bacterium]
MNNCVCVFSLTGDPTILRGENTASFYRNFLTIDLQNPDNIAISKAEFSTGNIKNEYPNPVFPINVNFDEKQTALLNDKNFGFLTLYDNQNRRFRCKGYCVFYANNGDLSYA